MTDAFKYLCLLMDMDNPRISAYEASMWPDDGFEKLLRQGFLQLAENAEYVTCPDCFGHQEEVVCRDYPGGIVRWFIPCPENGRVEIQPEELKQWSINFDSVARSLASRMNLNGGCMERAPRHVWRLGRWNLPEGKRDVLFAIGLTAAYADSFRRAITGAHKPIVFVAHEIPEQGLWKGKIPPLISLYHAADFKDDQIGLDPEYILDVVRQCEVEPGKLDSLTLEQIKLLIRKEIRTQGKLQITDDLLVATYASCTSYREAADLLTKQGNQKIGKDRVRRAVLKAGGDKAIVSDRVSDSVVRRTGRDSRDTAPNNFD